MNTHALVCLLTLFMALCRSEQLTADGGERALEGGLHVCRSLCRRAALLCIGSCLEHAYSHESLFVSD